MPCPDAPSGGRAESPRWTPAMAAWYARAMARSDYATAVLAAAAPALDGCRSALDVGAGVGALALPLARRVERVTALEPAPAMRRELRRAARAQNLGNIRVVPAAWGERPVSPHDVVLCAHVSPLLAPGSAFVAALPALARRGAVLVHGAPGGDERFFYRELYPLLLGRPYRPRCGPHDARGALAALGLAATVEVVRYRSDQPFTSLTEACAFWTAHMRLRGGQARAALRTFLAARLVRRGGRWVAPYEQRAVVVTWLR